LTAAAPPESILVLSLPFVVISLAVDGSWALLAGRARTFLAAHARLRSRITRGLLIAAPTALGVTRHR
jgi:homoserine/homoserine lactone efflux protein